MDTKALIETANCCPLRVVFLEVDLALDDPWTDPDLVMRFVRSRWDDGTVDREYKAEDVNEARAWWKSQGVLV